MSSSPKEQSAVTGSPTRYINRYSERYKSLLTESPPRDLKTTEKMNYSNLKSNSPLQSNRYNEYRLFEGEKYSTLKIKNEDRGEWRENSLFNEENLDEVESVQVSKPQPTTDNSSIKNIEQEVNCTRVSSPIKPSTPVRPSTPTKPSTPIKSSTPVREEPAIQHQHKQQQPQPQRTPSQTPQPSHSKRTVPHYMQATSSFETRVSYNKERRNQTNILGPRSKGGISKRVGTTKVPRYQSTTTIDAIQDIYSEMQPEDVYITMAARIKLFEKGLGNGSNKPAPIVRQSSSTSTNSSQPKRQPSRSTSSRVTSPSNSTLPSYARNTVASETKEASRRLIRSNTEKSTRMDRSKSFTTRNQEPTFHEKLNLWKGKDKIAAMESTNKNRGLKRKNPTTTNNDNTPTPHSKHLKK